MLARDEELLRADVELTGVPDMLGALLTPTGPVPPSGKVPVGGGWAEVAGGGVLLGGPLGVLLPCGGFGCAHDFVLTACEAA